LPSTDWQEVIPEGEPAQLEALAEKVREFQRANARGGKPSRGLHAKGTAGVQGKFIVGDDVPAEAKVGIFAKAGSYRAYVRFSNGAGRAQKDQVGDVRGIGVKLVGVPGKKLIPGLEDAVTQDFLAIRSSTQPFRNADEFVWLLGAVRPAALLPFKMIGRFGFGRGFKILKRLTAGLAMPPSLIVPYFSALPIRFGDYAARYALIPVEPESGEKGASADHLHDELAARLAKGPITYDFKVQFFVDETKTPIEDASVEWDAPWVSIAKLTLAKQELDSSRGKNMAAFIEQLSFDPWHAPVEFRPLGNMMRARNHAYRLSTAERKVSPEPDGSERFS
jgi:hypothetical protein